MSLKALNEAGVNKKLTLSIVKRHPVWKALADNDQHLLNEYTDAIFGEVNRYNEDTAMGIWIPSLSKEPHMRVWVLCGVGDFDGRSDANGRYHLDSYARLVGVRSEGAEGAAKTIQNPTLDQIMQTSTPS
jgi:hypothetical protein